MLAPEQFGAVGDGVADDRAALQQAIDTVSSGDVVCLSSDRTYRVVISYEVPERGLSIKAGKTLMMNGARINLEIDSNNYGIRLQSGSRIIGRGKVAVTAVSNVDSIQSIYQSVISLGDANGEIINMTEFGPYSEASDWWIYDLELSTVKQNGFHIAGIGGMRHGLISDIKVSDNSNAIGVVNFDWGTIGVPNTIPQNRANFDNGTFRTLHPSNITINRINVGTMAHLSSEPIRLSACNAITVRNVNIVGCRMNGVAHYGGDFGFEFCSDPVMSRRAFMGTSISGIILERANGASVIRCDCFADNIFREIGYIPLHNPIYETNILIENIYAENLSSDTQAGFNLARMKGGVFNQVFLRNFRTGFNCNSEISRAVFNDGVSMSYSSGNVLFAGDISNITQNRMLAYST